MYSLNNKVVMVTGCSGAVGSELINQLLSDPVEPPGGINAPMRMARIASATNLHCDVRAHRPGAA